MNKETGESRQPTIKEAIRELEKRNSKMGNMLFASVGKGKEKSLIFPTPINDENARKEEFLVATNSGWKTIAIYKNQEGNNNIKEKYIYQEIQEYLGKKYSPFWSSIWSKEMGYIDGRLVLDDGHLGINTSNAKHSTWWKEYRLGGLESRWASKSESYYNCRLEDADPDKVEKILKVNVERVKAAGASSQKARNIFRAA